MKTRLILSIILLGILLTQCKKTPSVEEGPENDPVIVETSGSNIDLYKLQNYANQPLPAYIKKNNAGNKLISDSKATLGRVLFYDKQLSIDNSISCGSCHIQEFAFGDTAISSKGVSGGKTARHSIRLINLKFGDEKRLFWDKRAGSLEELIPMPIKEHTELGYSGQPGRPSIEDMIVKLQQLPYYKVLFRFVYKDSIVSELRIKECLTDFIRSIQSFDSKYDQGRNTVNDNLSDFSNFTEQENKGKKLFMQSVVLSGDKKRVGGGLGCNGCHLAPEFDMNPAGGNNGITGKLNAAGKDYGVTRSPSLRDITRANGKVNTPMMHTGEHKTLDDIVKHYNIIDPDNNNPNIDPRLFNNGLGIKLNMTPDESAALIAFLKTLAGSNVYIDRKWSNPFIK